jgi:biotin carboxyl carrier protein
MMITLLLSYIAILWLFVWLRFIPLNLFWKLSPVIILLGLSVGLFIPMGWGAPSRQALVLRNSVQIVPSVAGEVIEVPVAANTPVKEGDILFRIDPTTYQAQVYALEAQLKRAEQRLGEVTQLATRGTGRRFDVEQRQAEHDQLKAELEGAPWNLDKTIVRAPANGYVTNLALRKGARVTTQTAVMAFIDTSETIFGAASASRSRSLSRISPERSTPVASMQCCRKSRKSTPAISSVSSSTIRRQHRPCGNLHRTHQGCPCDSPGDPTADRDPELRQSALNKSGYKRSAAGRKDNNRDDKSQKKITLSRRRLLLAVTFDRAVREMSRGAGIRVLAHWSVRSLADGIRLRLRVPSWSCQQNAKTPSR